MYILVIALALFIPITAVFAVGAPSDLKGLLDIFSGLINILIPLIFALTAIAIAWGVIRAWVMGDASTEDIDRGKKVALVGVIVLTIMISIWGILNLLQRSFFG
jgi:hypothetical protein